MIIMLMMKTTMEMMKTNLYSANIHVPGVFQVFSMY